MRQAVMQLGKIEYVAGLPAEEAEDLFSASELRRYPAGTPVFAQGEEMPGVFVVVKGALKVFQSDGRGKVQVVDIHYPGSCVGEVEAIGGGPATCGAVALGETECWLIPPMPLRLMADRENGVAGWLLQHFVGQIRRLTALVETLSLRTVPERVAQLILDHHGRTPGKSLVEFTETQEESGQRIGSSREAFSRALRLLADLGLIKNMFPAVRILDLPKLTRYARGCSPAATREAAPFSILDSLDSANQAVPAFLQVAPRPVGRERLYQGRVAGGHTFLHPGPVVGSGRGGQATSAS